MKKNRQRFWSVFCALLIIFSGMPVGITAGGESVSISANVSVGQESYAQISAESGYAALLKVEEDQRVILTAQDMPLRLDIYRGSDTSDRVGGAEGDPLKAMWDAKAGNYLLVFSAKDGGGRILYLQDDKGHVC